MRASRLVQLLLLLQTNGNMTASRLASELEVSVRTIYRDIEALSGAGVPIYAEAGPGGGVRLVDGYRTRLTGLTAEEAEALALSGLPGAASELGLVLKAGVWYLVARSGRTRSLRTFRVSRVVTAKVLAEECDRPEGFDLASHWAEASEEFLGSWPTIPVLVRVRHDLLWLVRYVQDPTRADQALHHACEPDVDGWITITLRFENQEMASYELMRFGGDLEVLEPTELRQAMAGRAASMVERYASPVPA